MFSDDKPKSTLLTADLLRMFFLSGSVFALDAAMSFSFYVFWQILGEVLQTKMFTVSSTGTCLPS